MEANETWTVIIETPSGLERVVVIRYSRRPTSDLAAGLVRLELGPNAAFVGYQDQDDASLQALQGVGYKQVHLCRNGWVAIPNGLLPAHENVCKF